MLKGICNPKSVLRALSTDISGSGQSSKTLEALSAHLPCAVEQVMLCLYIAALAPVTEVTEDGRGRGPTVRVRNSSSRANELELEIQF